MGGRLTVIAEAADWWGYPALPSHAVPAPGAAAACPIVTSGTPGARGERAGDRGLPQPVGDADYSLRARLRRPVCRFLPYDEGFLSGTQEVHGDEH